MHLQRTPKDLPNNLQTEEKTTKEEKTLFKRAYTSFTTDKSRIIHGLIAKQVTYKYQIHDCSICNSRMGGKKPQKSKKTGLGK